MKRFIKEYADDIQKEIRRRLAVLDDPHKITVYSRAKTEAASEKVKLVLLYAEKEAISVHEAMRMLTEADPRN